MPKSGEVSIGFTLSSRAKADRLFRALLAVAPDDALVSMRDREVVVEFARAEREAGKATPPKKALAMIRQLVANFS